jgi:hypothetical protein
MSTTNNAKPSAPRHGFDPHVVELMKLTIAGGFTPCEHVLAFLHEINDKFPSLSYRDFLIAVAAAELYEFESRGGRVS